MAEKKTSEVNKKPESVMAKQKQVFGGETISLKKSPSSKILYLLLAVVFFLPIFFLPWSGLAFPVAKKVLVVLLLAMAGSLSIWQGVKQKYISIPNSPLFYSVLSLFGGVFILNFLSPSWRFGLLGGGFENATVWSLFFGLIALALFAVNFTDRRSFVMAYLVFWVSSFIAIFLQFGRILLGTSLTLDFWSNAALNLVGKLNELGLLAGLFIVVSLVPLERLSKELTPVLKSILLVGVLVGGFVVVVSNYAVLWWLVGLSALLIYLLGLRSDKRRNLTKFLKPSVVIGLVFVLLAGSVAIPFISNKINIYNQISLFNNSRGVETLEVNPSIRGTFDIAKSVLTTSPLVGLGANNFSYGWSLYKSPEVNQTAFWDIDFNVGFGTLPTMAINSGLIGILLVLIFIVMAAFSLIRLYIEKTEDKFENTGNEIAVWAGVYLLGMTLFYAVETVGLMFLFIWLGLVLARLHKAGSVKHFRLPVSLSTESGLVSFGVGILLSLIFVLALLVSISNIVSLLYLQSGAGVVGEDVEKADNRIERSVFWRKSDLHYRILTEVKIAKMGAILNSGNLEDEPVVAAFQSAIDEAIGAGQNATRLNPTNYRNWLTLASVYEALVPIGVEGAYEQGLVAYEQAKRLAPRSPLVMLSLARLESARNELDKAKTYVDEALVLKPNYPQAVFLLAQIEAASGNLSSAVSRAESLAEQFPQDSAVLFQLGYLYYQADRFSLASQSFEQALNLNPSYADAAYFLGLSYDALGQTENALGVFRNLLSANPGNETLTQIITNIENGDSAMSSFNQDDSAGEILEETVEE